MMLPGTCLISNEGTRYRVLEVFEGTISLCPEGRSTIITYRLSDLAARFSLERSA